MHHKTWHKKYRANCFACAQLDRYVVVAFFCPLLLVPSDMGYATLNFRIRDKNGFFYVILLRFHSKCNTFSTWIKIDNRNEEARKALSERGRQVNTIKEDLWPNQSHRTRRRNHDGTKRIENVSFYINMNKKQTKQHEANFFKRGSFLI